MFIINAEIRKERSEGADRRPRVVSKFPAIIYGGKEAPLAVELDHDRVMSMQVKAELYSKVLTIVVDGKETKVKAQNAQRHPYKPRLLHVDFVRA